METGIIDTNDSNIKVYKYRWVVLGIFCLYAVINFMQFLQYSIISNVAVKYYDVDDILIDLTGLIFMVSFIILCVPVSHIIERYSLKVTALIGSGLTSVGNLIKLASVGRDRIAVVLVAQVFCGVAQVFILSIPTKIASAWFGPEQVSTACAIAVLGTQLGIAIGCITGPNVVRNSDDIDAIGDDLFTMMIYNAAFTCGIFLVVLIFFRSQPPLPPSQSQLSLLGTKREKKSTLAMVKTMMSNKNYLLLIGTFGVANGIWSSFGILFNSLYLEYFPWEDGCRIEALSPGYYGPINYYRKYKPGSETTVGWLSFAAVLAGGCIGSVFFGFLLDRTHKFKIISFVSIFIAAITLSAVVVTMYEEVQVATYFTIPIFGFFIASTLIIGFEYATEVTYPIPEAVSCGVLNAMIFLCSIIITGICEVLFPAIGYLYTVIIVIILLACSSVSVLFISPDLRRRRVNVTGENLS